MNAFEKLNNGDWIDGNATMVTSYRTWQFSGGWPPVAGWPSKNVHTDDEFARMCGIPGRAASGAMVQGYAADFLADIFGVDWLGNGSFNLKFVAPVQIGDTHHSAEPVASTHKVEGERTSYDVELLCENQRWRHGRSRNGRRMGMNPVDQQDWNRRDKPDHLITKRIPIGYRR